MELNSELTSLTALPLDAGLLAPRRPGPATGDQPDLFRQHFDAPSARAEQERPQKSQDDSAAPAKRERAGGSKKTEAKRGPDDRRRPEESSPAEELQAADDARPPAVEEDEAADLESTSASPIDDAEAAHEAKEQEAAEAEAIVAEVTAAVVATPVAPVELEDLAEIATVQAPAVNPVSGAAPAATEVPQEGIGPVEDIESLTAKANARKAANEVSSPKVEAIDPQEAKKSILAESEAVVQEEGAELVDKRSDTDAHAEKKEAGEITATVAADEELTISEESDDDRSNDHRKKPTGIKTASTATDAPPPSKSAQSDSGLRAASDRHANQNNLAAPVAPVAAAHKAAPSANGSSGPRGIGNVEAASPHRIPNHLIGKPGEAAGGEIKLSEAEQVRLLQRVARAFQTAQQREGEIKIRLSPPELGALKLEIKVKDGVMTARAEAETPAAQSLLIDNLPALRERLAEQNIRLDQFEVDLPGRQSQGQQENRDSQASSGGSRGGIGARETPGLAEASAPATRHHDGKLNVII